MVMNVETKYGETNRDYHADKTYIGSSLLKAFRTCTLLFMNTLMSAGSSNTSNSLAFGTHFHNIREVGWERWREERAIITPDDFITASGNISTKKAAKEWMESLKPDQLPLTASDVSKLEKIEEMFWKNDAVARMEKSIAVREPSVRWKEPDWRFGFRVRPDGITEDGIIIDFKTHSEPSPLQSFRYAYKKYQYGLSAALYLEGCRLAGIANKPMQFVVVSTVPPYQTQLIEVDEETQEYWHSELEMLMAEIQTADLERPRGYGFSHTIKM